MKKIITSIALVFTLFLSQAQKKTYDIISYTAPAGWSESMQENVIVYTMTDKVKKNWSQIGIYRSVTGSGNTDQDFSSSWQNLVDAYYHTGAAQLQPVTMAGDWQIKTGKGKFLFQKTNALVSLTTYSGNGVIVNIVVTSNNNTYALPVKKFLESIELKKPDITKPADVVKPPAPAGKFAFSETNFDDGWTSRIREDWVEVTKGEFKVLLHFPNSKSIFPADPDPLTRAAWNVLSAPHYTAASDFKILTVNDYKRVYWLSANTTDQNGKRWYVVLFRQGGGWIEFMAPDKNTFVRQFGPDDNTIRWDSDVQQFAAMSAMASYNKFAVSASDLDGSSTWKEHFSSSTFYSNYYTGAYEGMSTYSSSQWFDFTPGQHYTWHLVAANTYGGSTAVASGKGAGTFRSIGNWQLYFSELEGKAKTFDVYYTATKNGRILWMNDAKYPGSGIFTGYEKAN